jgi:glycosyltransferase involved in cell wall biosynthesis
MPKVSVVIPTYNRPQFVRSAITSVLNQTFQDFEIIVVDDASTDNTPEVVSGFNDTKIKYIRHEINKGGSAARNTGIRTSSAEYIAFLDDDDEWLPDKLKKQVELLNISSPNVGGVYTGFFKINKASGKIIGQSIPLGEGGFIDDLIEDNRIGTTSTHLLRRECFEKVGLFDENLPSSQDFDMWVRLSKEFHFEFIKEPLVKYSFHEKRISTDIEKKIKGIEIILERYGQLLSSNRRSHSQSYLSLGILYCYNGNTKKGRESLLKAIKLYPYEIRTYFYLALSLLGANAFKKLGKTKQKIVAQLNPKSVRI